ncbi:DUF1073 domain-containing protein [Selenomonas felix]|jgi:phage-related protein (TIGR01555 family)|uniref:phage portal protein n=1 Tax=Selenomonas felix TaxID=1944634 RepID=UPI0020504724|nr:DUF1073 domain-containing protein [Selenomonas felix]DAY45590.1 MAG TPA: Portal [Caudoviricetes sp.]
MDRQDGFFNAVIGHGLKSRDPFAAYQFGMPRLMSDQEADDLFTFNGIANKIITEPANEAVRTGFDLKNGDAVIDQNEQLCSVFEDLKGQKRMAEALMWDRLYGGCAVLMVIDDGGTLEDPLNEANIRKIERLQVFEAPDVTYQDSCLYGDPSDPAYGKPQFYTLVNYQGQSLLVHESRLLLFRGGVISNRRRRMRNGWGGRVFDRIAQELTNYNSSLSLSLMAISRLSQGILKFSGMESLLQNDFGEEQVRKRLQLIDMARHMMNTIAIDTADEYDQKNMTIAGLKDIIQEFELALSAVTNIPATVLFGRSPAGMNATGKADFEAYYNMVSRIQQRTLRPALLRLFDVISKAKEYPFTLPESYTIAFKPLWNPTEKEIAETANIKAQAKEHEANAARSYMDIGALDISEIRRTLKDDGEYIMDDSLDDELLEKREEDTNEGDGETINPLPDGT